MRRPPALVAACLFLIAPPAAAGGFGAHLRTAPRLLGDAGGPRATLARVGVDVQAYVQTLLAWKPRGGADRGGRTGYSGSYDLLVYVDGDELFGARGLTAFAQMKGEYDRNLNSEVGALSDPYDDADWSDAVYLDQLWLQQAFFSGRVNLRLGMLESQTLFDRNAIANSEDVQFMAAALDNDLLVPLPRGLGASVLLRPVAGLELAAALIDADNSSRTAGFETFADDVDGWTGYLELKLQGRIPDGRDGLPGALRLGVFRDGRELDEFDERDPADGSLASDRGHVGYYLSADQEVFREAGDREQGLGLFARFGWADGDVNRVKRFASAGLRYVGLLPGRPRDTLGLAGYQMMPSKTYRREIDGRFERETGVELYYRIQPLPWVTVTPDVQYIVNPGGSRGASNAVVTALRIRVSL